MRKNYLISFEFKYGERIIRDTLEISLSSDANTTKTKYLNSIKLALCQHYQIDSLAEIENFIIFHLE